MLLLKSQPLLNKLLRSHSLLQVLLLKVSMKANNQVEKESQTLLKRSLLMLLPRLVLLSEVKRLEMKLHKSRPRENLKELMPTKQNQRLRMMLNQLRKPRKRRPQLTISQPPTKPSKLKSNLQLMSQLMTVKKHEVRKIMRTYEL
jgi:hypothetical protein